MLLPVTLLGLRVSFWRSSLACMATSPVGADSPPKEEEGPLLPLLPLLNPSPVVAALIRSSREVAL